MRNPYLRLGVTMFVFVMIFGCDVIKLDSCDGTELNVEDRITVTSNQVGIKIVMDASKYPAAYTLNYKVSYTKVRCGGNTTNYYTSAMYSDNAKGLEYIETTKAVSCSTEFRNYEDYVLVEMTCSILDIGGNTLASGGNSEKYTYDDVDHAAHNGSTNIVPYLEFKFN